MALLNQLTSWYRRRMLQRGICPSCFAELTDRPARCPSCHKLIVYPSESEEAEPHSRPQRAASKPRRAAQEPRKKMNPYLEVGIATFILVASPLAYRQFLLMHIRRVEAENPRVIERPASGSGLYGGGTTAAPGATGTARAPQSRTPGPEGQRAPRPALKVYLAPYGTEFHTADCRHVFRSKKPIDIREAIAKGYTACKECNPEAAYSDKIRRRK